MLVLLIRETFSNNVIIEKITNGTCYIDDHCIRISSTSICLDWREYCDGKIDCLNGHDEHYCSTLEINNCPKESFRCQNGMCIPKDFTFDYYLDCMDNSEEDIDEYLDQCYKMSDNECDKHHCGLMSFSCGDGQCVEHAEDFKCKTNRDKFYIKTMFTEGNT
ncbi:unnamed protein product, partial [Didymodactylos carnosus]